MPAESLLPLPGQGDHMVVLKAKDKQPGSAWLKVYALRAVARARRLRRRGPRSVSEGPAQVDLAARRRHAGIVAVRRPQSGSDRGSGQALQKRKIDPGRTRPDP